MNFYSEIAFVLWFTIDMTLAASQSEIGLTHASQFRSFFASKVYLPANSPKH